MELNHPFLRGLSAELRDKCASAPAPAKKLAAAAPAGDFTGKTLARVGVGAGLAGLAGGYYLASKGKKKE